MERRTSLHGVWVTPRQYAQLFQLSEQGLANARSPERRTGQRDPHAPIWRKFGKAVRHLVPEDLLGPAARADRDDVKERPCEAAMNSGAAIAEPPNPDRLLHGRKQYGRARGGRRSPRRFR